MTKVINLKEKREQIAENNFMGFMQELLAAGKMINPSGPYNWVADKLEEASKWGKKDWEFIFKREMSFQELRSIQKAFADMTQAIRTEMEKVNNE